MISYAHAQSIIALVGVARPAGLCKKAGKRAKLYTVFWYMYMIWHAYACKRATIMTKPAKIDWVSLIDQVWDQESSESDIDNETQQHAKKTESPLLHSPQMRLCIEKVSVSSPGGGDCILNEDPLKQEPLEPKPSKPITVPKASVSPSLPQSNTRQTDILWYLDKVYKTETQLTKTPPQRPVNCSPSKESQTPLNKSLSTIGNEARQLFPTSIEDEGHSDSLRRNTRHEIILWLCVCWFMVCLWNRKRKQTVLGMVGNNKQPTKRSRTSRKKKSVKKENVEQLYLVNIPLESVGITCFMV